MGLQHMVCHLSSDRNSEKRFPGQVVSGSHSRSTVSKGREEEKSEHKDEYNWSDSTQRKYAKVRSRRPGWGSNKSLEKGVLNSSLNAFDLGRLFQAASDVCNKNEPLLSF